MAKIRVYPRPKINYRPNRLDLKKPPMTTINRKKKESPKYKPSVKNELLKISTPSPITIVFSGITFQLELSVCISTKKNKQ
jgi:hypothetical protein